MKKEASITKTCVEKKRREIITFGDLPSLDQKATVKVPSISPSFLEFEYKVIGRGARGLGKGDSHALTEQDHKASLFRTIMQIQQDHQLYKTVGQNRVERHANEILILLPPVRHIARECQKLEYSVEQGDDRGGDE